MTAYVLNGILNIRNHTFLLANSAFLMLLECLFTDRRRRFGAGGPRSIAFIIIFHSRFVRLVELSGRPLQQRSIRKKRVSAG